jgi:Uma2 family endonuclease
MVTATQDDLIPEAIREIALVRPLTADDLATFPADGNRYEIIGGMLILSPAPTSRHQDVVMQLATWLNLYMLQTSSGKVFSAPIDVHLSINDVVQPDIVVVQAGHLKRIEEKGIVGAPDIVIEILSPSTARADRVWKAALYARSGVQEYWIVDPVEEKILVQSLEEDRYITIGTFAQDAELRTPILPALNLDLKLVFLDAATDAHLTREQSAKG